MPATARVSAADRRAIEGLVPISSRGGRRSPGVDHETVIAVRGSRPGSRAGPPASPPRAPRAPRTAGPRRRGARARDALEELAPRAARAQIIVRLGHRHAAPQAQRKMADGGSHASSSGPAGRAWRARILECGAARGQRCRRRSRAPVVSQTNQPLSACRPLGSPFFTSFSEILPSIEWVNALTNALRSTLEIAASRSVWPPAIVPLNGTCAATCFRG